MLEASQHYSYIPACPRVGVLLAAGNDCLQEEDGNVMVRDDLDALLQVALA